MHPFNVRVYGVLIKDDQLLIEDTFIRGRLFTKLPGGGLEFGEGTRECLMREFMEETGLTVDVREHFYTTDFFQPSAFRPKEQVISIYYLVEAKDVATLQTKQKPFDFSPAQVADPNGEAEVFRWIKLDELTEETFSLPIDKVVARLIKQQR